MDTVVLSANTSWYLYNFRASTIRALREQGYHVACLAPEDTYSRKLESELDCEWLPLDMDNQGNNPLRDSALLFQFWRNYRTIQPVAACHFTVKNNVYGTWAARVLGIPAINTITGLGTAFVHRGLVPGIVRLLYRASQGFAHTVFCQNEEDRALLADAGLVPTDRIQLVPGSGVDLRRFQPQPPAAAGARPFRFLYAGRMLRDKGLLELRGAMQALVATSDKPCELWLCGFADARNVSALSQAELEQWGTEPGVRWLGPSDAMQEIYRDVDCVVLPSYREGLPRSLLEAGAMALPVIAADVPGCRSVVSPGYNGLLCSARNAESLAAAMREMLDLPQRERTAMGHNGRAMVEKNYDETLVVQATLSAVRSAVQQGAAGA